MTDDIETLRKLVERDSYRSMYSKLNCTDRKALKALLERVERYEEALNNIAYGMKSYGDTAKELQIEAKQALEGGKGD